MSVSIRMSRHGAKKKPFYRIVVSDQDPHQLCSTPIALPCDALFANEPSRVLPAMPGRPARCVAWFG